MFQNPKFEVDTPYSTHDESTLASLIRGDKADDLATILLSRQQAHVIVKQNLAVHEANAAERQRLQAALSGTPCTPPPPGGKGPVEMFNDLLHARPDPDSMALITIREQLGTAGAMPIRAVMGLRMRSWPYKDTPQMHVWLASGLHYNKISDKKVRDPLVENMVVRPVRLALEAAARRTGACEIAAILPANKAHEPHEQILYAAGFGYRDSTMLPVMVKPAPDAKDQTPREKMQGHNRYIWRPPV